VQPGLYSILASFEDCHASVTLIPSSYTKFLVCYEDRFTNSSSVVGSREMIQVFVRFVLIEFSLFFSCDLNFIDSWLCELNVNCAVFESCARKKHSKHAVKINNANE